MLLQIVATNSAVSCQVTKMILLCLLGIQVGAIKNYFKKYGLKEGLFIFVYRNVEGYLTGYGISASQDYFNQIFVHERKNLYKIFHEITKLSAGSFHL